MFFCPPVCFGETRVWRDIKGNSVAAKFSHANSQFLQIETSTKKIVRVKISELSDVDRKYVADRTAFASRGLPDVVCGLLAKLNETENGKILIERTRNRLSFEIIPHHVYMSMREHWACYSPKFKKIQISENSLWADKDPIRSDQNNMSTLVHEIGHFLVDDCGGANELSRIPNGLGNLGNEVIANLFEYMFAGTRSSLFVCDGTGKLLNARKSFEKALESDYYIEYYKIKRNRINENDKDEVENLVRSVVERILVQMNVAVPEGF